MRKMYSSLILIKSFFKVLSNINFSIAAVGESNNLENISKW